MLAHRPIPMRSRLVRPAHYSSLKPTKFPLSRGTSSNLQRCAVGTEDVGQPTNDILASYSQSVPQYGQPTTGLPQEASAQGQTILDPRYMQAQSPQGYPQQMYAPQGYQQPGMAPQYYYSSAPPPHYQLPPVPTQTSATGLDSIPWFIMFMLGAAAIKVFDKIQEFTKKGPQAMMAEMAMKQMMGSMANNSGAPPGFGAPPPWMTPPPSAAPSSAPIETTATSVQPSDSSSMKPGQRFASRQAGADAATNGARPLDFVDPLVREPTPSRGFTSQKTGASFFTDVSDDKNGKADAGSQSADSSTASSSGGDDGVMNSMLDNMLKNPEMQKMLYPYLPEPMRNPESIQFMMNNPEVRKQMEQMFSSQGSMSPQMREMMKNMDFNQEKMNQQFADLGMKPEDVLQKVMSNPELTAAFSNPKIQNAIMEISQNPMNITKYQNDPEVLKVLDQVTTLFSPHVNQKPPS